MASIDIRNTTDTDLEDILRINRAAFNQDEEADLDQATREATGQLRRHRGYAS